MKTSRLFVALLLALGGSAVSAQNPIIHDQFTADPTARVFNGKVYVYPSHDIKAPEGQRQDWFCMEDYHVFSSEDLVEWTDHGMILSQDDVPWVKPKSYSMWAPDCVEKNGRYYFYFPSTPTSGRGFGIGVAVGSSPEGPFRPMWKPIEGVFGIDPGILIDDDGQAYMYWGGVQQAKLKDNMMELATKPEFVNDLPKKGLKEGPFPFKRNGKYYLTFPWAKDSTEVLAYCMADKPLGPWEFKGVFMDESPTGCWTNHHSILEYNGQWYIFYHHNDYSPEFDKNRSARIDTIGFNPDGTIKKVIPTLRGVGNSKARTQIQIDRYSEIAPTASIAYLNENNKFEGWKTQFNKSGAWVRYNRVEFGQEPVKQVKLRVLAPKGAKLEVSVAGGKSIATVNVPRSANWEIISAPVKKSPTGLKDLKVTLKSGQAEVDWVVFDSQPWTAGALQTGKYRNLLAELGYKQADIDAKLNSVFDSLFYGTNKIYFEVGDDMGYISDIKNNDVRTEGMSYGMMVAVQLDKKDIFDRLWRWAVKYMQHQEGNHEGYFAWSCKTDGTRNSQGPASDGELYYVTSLIFASNRWGNDTGINYLAEAQRILNCSMQKIGMDNVSPFINIDKKLITFTPDPHGGSYTDPSYHLPAFYEVWAKYANDGRANFWKECARVSREYLHKSIHPETGLNPDYNNYDGSLRGSRGIIGDAFRFDSWRVPMNIALDYSWSCADREWQQNYANTIQNFLYSQGLETFVDQYNVDGTKPERILGAGGYTALRHSLGLVSTAAAVSLAATNDKIGEFVNHMWNSKHEPYEDGYFDAYYDGLLHLFALMHLSGNYQVITPKQ